MKYPLSTLLLFALPASSAIIANPTVTGSATEHSGGFLKGNVVDGKSNEYASASKGDATFLEFTFAAPTSFDTVVVVNRNSGDGSDLIANYTLTYADSSTSSIVRSALRGGGGFDSLGRLVTTTTVRLDVDTIGAGSAKNTGAMEVYFLRTSEGMNLVTGVNVVATSNAPYGAGFAPANATNGVVGRSDTGGVEFAGNQGTNTFVTFDLGSLVMVGGFDFFDRMVTVDKVTSFNMIFSEDATFDGSDIVRSYTGSTQSDEFVGIMARYVQWDVTGANSANMGIGEMRFYSVPEPSTAVLGLAGLALFLRRRRA